MLGQIGRKVGRGGRLAIRLCGVGALDIERLIQILDQAPDECCGNYDVMLTPS